VKSVGVEKSARNVEGTALSAKTIRIL